jgi:hypothetical protein
MTHEEIDALVDRISRTGGFDIDPSMTESVIRSELHANWDSIPHETRAVMLATASTLRRLLQPTSGTGRAISEAFAELATALQRAPRAGVSGVDRQTRVDYTRCLIANGATVLATRDRLMATFRISRTESYRLIATAREASQKMHELGTLSAIDSMCRRGVQTNLDTRID